LTDSFRNLGALSLASAVGVRVLKSPLNSMASNNVVGVLDLTEAHRGQFWTKPRDIAHGGMSVGIMLDLHSLT
jgi:hypothetical protein